MRIRWEVWEIDRPVGVVRNEISTQLGVEPEEVDEEYRWRVPRLSGSSSFSVVLNRGGGTVSSETHVPSPVKYIPLLPFCIGLLTWTRIGWMVSAAISACMLLYLLFPSPPNFSEVATNTERGTSRVVTAFLVVLAVSTYLSVEGFYSPVYDFAFLLLCLAAGGILYGSGAFGGEVDAGQEFIFIPITGILGLLVGVLPLILLSMMYQVPSSLSLAGSVIAVLVVSLNGFFFLTCRKVIEAVVEVSPSSVESNVARTGVLLLYITANLLLLGVLTLGGILAVHVSTGFAPVGLEPATVQLLQVGYENIDSYFQDFPLVSARSYTILFHWLVLSPLVVLVGSWAFHIVETVRDAIRVLRLDWELFCVTSSETVSVARIDDERLFAVPKAPFFGILGEVVVVSQGVCDQLSEDERRAVIAHELFHLRNRDLYVNFVAGIFSVLLGGRNGLLVFYDYPQIEQEADRYAADLVGSEPLISAINKTRSPVRTRSGLRKYLTAPYDLFFGNVLFVASHASADTRIKRIQQGFDT